MVPIDESEGKALVTFWSTDGTALVEALDLVHRRALEPDRGKASDERATLAAWLARDLRPRARDLAAVRARADPRQPGGGTITSGSNSSATACSGW